MAITRGRQHAAQRGWEAESATSVSRRTATPGWQLREVRPGAWWRGLDPPSLESSGATAALRRRLSRAVLFCRGPEISSGATDPAARLRWSAAMRRILQRGEMAPVPTALREGLEARAASDVRRLVADEAAGAAASWSAPRFERDPGLVLETRERRALFDWVEGRCGGAVARWLTPAVSLDALVCEGPSDPGGGARVVDLLFTPPWSPPVAFLIDSPTQLPANPLTVGRAAALKGVGFEVERFDGQDLLTFPPQRFEPLAGRLRAPEGPSDPSVLSAVFLPVFWATVGLALVEGVERGWLRGDSWRLEMRHELDRGPELLTCLLDLFQSVDRILGGAVCPREVAAVSGSGEAFELRRPRVERLSEVDGRYESRGARSTPSPPDLRIGVELEKGPIDALPPDDGQATIVVRGSTPPREPEVDETTDGEGPPPTLPQTSRAGLRDLVTLLAGVDRIPDAEIGAVLDLLGGRDVCVWGRGAVPPLRVAQLATLLLPGTTVHLGEDSPSWRAQEWRSTGLGLDPPVERPAEHPAEGTAALREAPRSMSLWRSLEVLRSGRVTPGSAHSEGAVSLLVIDEVEAICPWCPEFGHPLGAHTEGLRGPPGEPRPTILACGRSDDPLVRRDARWMLDDPVQVESTDPEEGPSPSMGLRVHRSRPQRALDALVPIVGELADRVERRGPAIRPGLVVCSRTSGLAPAAVAERIRREGRFDEVASVDEMDDPRPALAAWRRNEVDLLVGPLAFLRHPPSGAAWRLVVGWPGSGVVAGCLRSNGEPSAVLVLDDASTRSWLRLAESRERGELPRAAGRRPVDQPVSGDVEWAIRRHLEEFPGLDRELAPAARLLAALRHAAPPWGRVRRSEDDDPEGFDRAVDRLAMLGWIVRVGRDADGRWVEGPGSPPAAFPALRSVVWRHRPSAWWEARRWWAGRPAGEDDQLDVLTRSLKLLYDEVEPHRRRAIAEAWIPVTSARAGHATDLRPRPRTTAATRLRSLSAESRFRAAPWIDLYEETVPGELRALRQALEDRGPTAHPGVALGVGYLGLAEDRRDRAWRDAVELLVRGSFPEIVIEAVEREKAFGWLLGEARSAPGSGPTSLWEIWEDQEVEPTGLEDEELEVLLIDPGVSAGEAVVVLDRRLRRIGSKLLDLGLGTSPERTAP